MFGEVLEVVRTFPVGATDADDLLSMALLRCYKERMRGKRMDLGGKSLEVQVKCTAFDVNLT